MNATVFIFFRLLQNYKNSACNFPLNHIGFMTKFPKQGVSQVVAFAGEAETMAYSPPVS